MGKYKSYEEFLNKTYPNLYFSNQVQHIIQNGDTRNEAVKKYMERLKKIHEKVFSSNRESDISLLKSFYYENYVIKEEDISDNYFRFLDKQYFDKYGIHMDDETKQTHIENIIEDQKESLDVWLDYLCSKDAKDYPIWAKYWAFQGMLTIGSYDNGNQIYKKRTKETTSKFVELNRESFAKCIDYIINLVDNGRIETIEQISSENFAKIYQVLLGKFKAFTFDKTRIDGKWIKYEQGNNYLPLYNSLQGYGTGWCTAGKDTCRKQIKNGDFYVYYTIDENNSPVIPRIAIRMDGKTRIGEIRGVAKDQNIESHLEEVLEEKLKEFPDRQDYDQRINDSKTLTRIYEKYEQKIELNVDELKFIYETERKIKRFGYNVDPRIEIIKSSRNIIDDCSKMYNLSQTPIEGDLYLNDLPSVKVLDLSQITVGGDLNLERLKSAEGLILPKSIGGSLYLNRLTSAKGLDLSKTTISKGLYLNSLTSAENLKLPQNIVGDLNLSSLKSADGLVLPKCIGESLYLNSLIGAKGLDLSKTTIGRSLYLNGLTSADGLKLPQNIVEDLILSGLKSAEGLTLPKNIGRDLDLSSLTNAEGLDLSQTTINGWLDLRSLTNAEGLNLSQATIGRYLNLSGLTNAKGLNLSQTTIGGSLDLCSLKNAKGLDLSKTTISGNLNLHDLTSSIGLIFPQNIGGCLFLQSLTSAEGLDLSQTTIGGNLFLNRLTSAEGLELPEDFDLNRLVCKQEVKEQLFARKHQR